MVTPAVNGVVNTNAPLTAINIPVGAVEQSKATTTMSMTATGFQLIDQEPSLRCPTGRCMTRWVSRTW